MPSRSRVIAACVFLALAIAAPFSLLAGASIAYPDNKGFVRTVLFVRPDPGDVNPGYFIIIDEFFPGTTQEVVFHSYGNLTVDAGAGLVSFNQSGTIMRLHFPGTRVAITSHANWVYATYPGRPENDWVEYVKVAPLDGARRLVTVMTFANETVSFPDVDVDTLADHLLVSVRHAVNDMLLLPLPTAETASLIETGPVMFSGRVALWRVNASLDVEWLLATGCTRLSMGTTHIHDGNPVSGMVHHGETTLTLVGTGDGLPSTHVPSMPFDPALLDGLESPFLLFSESHLPALRTKWATQAPWSIWYNALGTGSVLNKAFKGRVANDPALVNDAIAMILGIDDLDFDWINEQKISMSTTLYPYLFAYDMVHPNVSVANRTIIDGKLVPKLEVLADAISSGSVPTNNHIVVTSAALGIGGLLYKNATWVQLTQDANDFYLQHRVRPNGPCYEGDVYGRYTYDQGIKFFITLKAIGGHDYFTNPRFQAFLNYTVASMSPLGWTPSFEDCAVKQHLGNLASIGTWHVNATNPVLASNLQWHVEHVYGNPNAGADVYRITSYKGIINPAQPDVGVNQGFSYFDSGISVFRDGWSRDSTYLVISNKDYEQSHVALDENSIEVYAMGKKFLTNAGYPHWRREGHDYTISTEASNTVLINGQGQLDTISDGLGAALLSAELDFLESPSFLAYASPFHPWRNPVLVVSGFLAGALLGACAVLTGWMRAKRTRGPGTGEREVV